MQRIIAAIILTSLLVFGLLHAAAGASFAHAAHGSMAGGMGCMIASCPASENGGMQTMDCITHCLSAATTEFPVSPILPALFVIAFLVLLARASTFSVVDDLTRRFTDVIGRLLLRRRLATVVLRN